MSVDVAEAATWVPDLTAFSTRLAVVRNRMGWNAKEAALACGLPASSWRNWEAGKRPHDLAMVCNTISRRTGVPATWLAFGPEAMQAARDTRGSGVENRAFFPLETAVFEKAVA